MAFEVEAAGALMTAGLAANEIEGEAGNTGAAGTTSLCANCQTPLTGRYCHQCGQPAQLHRSLLRLGEEVAHGMMRFDAKGWRTLPMLVLHPGQLTRRYIDGQRARFVSPLGLFLFTIFLMFFVFSFTAKNDFMQNDSSPASRAKVLADFEQELKESKDQLANAEAALAKAMREHDGIAEAQTELQSARVELLVAQKKVDGTRAANQAAAATAPAKDGANDADLKLETPAWADKIHTGYPTLDASIRKNAKNPELALYKIKNTAYKFAFLLVPISLPFLWLMFVFRRGVTLYDHAVFVLYSLSFMSLLFSAIAIAGHVGSEGLLALLLLAGPPVHMFAQLRGTYGLGKWGALWRTALLLVVAIIVFALFLLLVLMLSVQ